MDWETPAHRALLRAGVIEACREGHEWYVRALDDKAGIQHAYAIATNMVRKGEVPGSRREFIAFVAETLEQIPVRCPICEAADQVL